MPGIEITIYKKPSCRASEECRQIKEDFLANMRALVGLAAEERPVSSSVFHSRSTREVVCRADEGNLGEALAVVMGVSERHGVHFTETNLERYGPAWMFASRGYKGPAITVRIHHEGYTP